MTGEMRRQLALLAVLGVVLAGVLRWQFGGSAPAAGAPQASNPSSAATGARSQAGTVADVHLEALSAKRDEASAPDRNLFRFRPRAVAPPVRQAPSRPEVISPPVPTGPPPPPAIPLKFHGVLDGPSRIGRVAFLTDSRGNTFYGKEGDIIDGRYQVLRIGTESVELAYVDGRGRQAIRLSGQ